MNSLQDKFMTLVSVEQDCWRWMGSVRGGRYGQFYDPRAKKMQLAHRISFELFNGPPPPGLVIDHICRNKVCVNPKHLRAISNKENVLIGDGPFAVNARKTHCNRGHAFDRQKQDRGMRIRECQKCRTIRQRENRAKAREFLAKVKA